MASAHVSAPLTLEGWRDLLPNVIRSQQDFLPIKRQGHPFLLNGQVEFELVGYTNPLGPVRGRGTFPSFQVRVVYPDKTMSGFYTLGFKSSSAPDGKDGKSLEAILHQHTCSGPVEGFVGVLSHNISYTFSVRYIKTPLVEVVIYRKVVQALVLSNA